MADVNDKLPDNVPGKFYVDDNCIDCDVCRDTAPSNFRRNSATQFSYVYKQPETEKEIEQCVESMEVCPVEAIGDNG